MTEIKYKPSQKNALVTASRYCSIFKAGPNVTDWVLSKPWKATDYRGPSTHVRCGTNDQARRRMALAVADIAMEILLEGEDPAIREEAYMAMAYESQHNGGSAAILLKIGLQAAERFEGEFKENTEGETE